MDADVITSIISTLASAGIGGFLISLLRSYFQRRELRARRTVIGIVHCNIPACLTQYPDFTDYSKCAQAGYRLSILHCRNLSYALRHCDFVVTEENSDEKIINCHDTTRIIDICRSVDGDDNGVPPDNR